MKIIESFSEGKKGDAVKNEDRIVVNGHFAGILDGATDRQGVLLDGRAPGRFASDIVGDAILNLAPDITAPDAILQLTHILRIKTDEVLAREGKGTFDDLVSKPICGLTLYSRMRHEIWRVADGHFGIDGKINYGELEVDPVASNMRRLYVLSALARGAKVDDLRRDDPALPAIKELWLSNRIFINNDCPAGFGVINGASVPARFIEVHSVPETAHEITITSDGYFEVLPTLEQTEKRLFEILNKDPLLIGDYRSVKAWEIGQKSFDDRSYLRFEI